jgi:pimeloyl-ACP methyl ester carboxylesterase
MRILSSKQFVFILFFVPFIFINCNSKPLVTVVNTNGEEIHFSNTGEGDVALVFIHGYGNYQGIWEGQVAHFSDRYQVIALDLPGFGLSSHHRTEWTTENFGKDVAGVIDELKLKKVVLIGFSMGAPVAVEAAHLLKDKALGLILVDEVRDLKIHFSDEAIAGIKGFLSDLMANPSEEKLVQGGFFKQNTAETFQKILKMMEENPSQVGWDDIMSNMFKWANEKDEAAFSSLSLPVSLINSDHQPTNSDQLNAIISDLSIDIVANSGHCIFWDFPEEFNALIEKNVKEFQ